MTGPTQGHPNGDVRVVPRFIGPASLVGVCIGTLLIGVSLWLGPRVHWLWLLPLLGSPLLMAPGRLRQFGAGLLLSLATVPSLGFSWLTLFAVISVLPSA